MSIYTCSKGHASVESDYCSECGVKIAGNNAVAIAGIASPPRSSQICPDCTAPHEVGSGNFCEICGYNFVTGGHGEVPIPIATPLSSASISSQNTSSQGTSSQGTSSQDAASDTVNQGAIANVVELAVTNDLPSLPVIPAFKQEHFSWELVVSIDPALASPDSPPPPRDLAPVTFRLEKPSNLIGRTSELRAIHPEVPLDYDDAVSSRHALVNRRDDGSYVLRDIGSSNGTLLNGIEIKSLVDIPLKNGDRIALGHWSSIEVKAIPNPI
ncbi:MULTISPECIES: FHA domain-containing protein [Pseudanabaena]|uniref:Forkhead-associated protein n=2 Tax=Pseudanabaena TaxID=1152 RepID=L8N130_9CYAN|nr:MULTISPECIES: FHA domain-containing protein [Pseudanabaena]ELS33426.1 Forkhead-associated protein [Pseudanabaena biceps PCC 7429]MDG3494364.1 FHA domain-containing protein [Pseudanabaena catenata USMAC16]